MAGRQPARKRRDPDDARREILEAAEGFLARRPFRELTVDAVMAETGLSRPSFYVYFPDRYALVTTILEGVGTELFAIDRTWLDGPAETSRAALRHTIAATADFFGRRGRLLRAIADAAATDPEVERQYRHGLIQGFAAAVGERIVRGVRDGEMLSLVDPGATALVLVLMAERALLDAVALGGTDALATVVPALGEVWERTLYPPA